MTTTMPGLGIRSIKEAVDESMGDVIDHRVEDER